MTCIYFDIETASADELYTYGPGFCRLAGYAADDGEVQFTTDMDHLCQVLTGADRIYAHNAIGFDLAALEQWHGLDVGLLVAQGRVRDTLLMARHNDPPLSGKVDSRRYGLDRQAELWGLPEGKLLADGESALRRLAKQHGGYDKIPLDDPEYREYLRRDVVVLRELAKRLRTDEYLLREHKVMWRLNHISRFGFRVDADRARAQVSEQEARAEELKADLHARYGLPLEGKAPHRTKAGAEALEKAFADCGLEASRTEKGALATGKEAMEDLLEAHPDNEALVALCGLLLALNGQRSTPQTLLDSMGRDGRVHPGVDAGQATGRISVTKPGLTVLGKRERGQILERALLLPDEGDVLLAFDLSQVDARAIAAHSQDPAYIAAFAPGRDYHCEMAEALFGDPGRRNDAKPVTHATTYGMGPRGLAQVAGIEEYEAQRLLFKLDDQFPKLARLKEWVRAEAADEGFVWTAFGRPVRIAEGKAYTQGPAALGQGTARDLMMEGILRLPVELLPRLRAIVHDEVVLSVPAEQVDQVREQVMAALQFEFRIDAGALPVPVLAGASDAGADWADCYRGEKPGWPEVAKAHRDTAACADEGCTWHFGAA